MKNYCIKICVWKDTDGIRYDPDTFATENANTLKAIFEDPDDFSITFLNEALGMQVEYENLSNPMKFFISDLKNSGSSLCRFFGVPQLEGRSNTLENGNMSVSQFTKKMEIFQQVLNAYARYSVCLERPERTGYDIFYGNLGFHFRGYVSQEVLEELSLDDCPFMVDIDDLPQEEILLNIVPYYYKELSMWDRAALRNDAKMMAFLQENWMETLRMGLA